MQSGCRQARALPRESARLQKMTDVGEEVAAQSVYSTLALEPEAQEDSVVTPASAVLLPLVVSQGRSWTGHRLDPAHVEAAAEGD